MDNFSGKIVMNSAMHKSFMNAHLCHFSYMDIKYPYIIPKRTSPLNKEHGTLVMLGLSPSLLGGGTQGNPPHNMWTPQMPPGPGQQHCLSKFQKNSDIQEHLPSTGGGCNSSIGCNARGLILDSNSPMHLTRYVVEM